MPNGSEKLRIAHDLHDGVVQDLAALGYAIDSVIGNPCLTPELRSELREIRLESSRITAAFRNEVQARGFQYCLSLDVRALKLRRPFHYLAK